MTTPWCDHHWSALRKGRHECLNGCGATYIEDWLATNNPKCTKYSDDSVWCACDNCVARRGKVRIVKPDGTETFLPRSPYSEKLLIMDRMREATLAWLTWNIEAKDLGAVIRIAASLAEIDAERAK